MVRLKKKNKIIKNRNNIKPLELIWVSHAADYGLLMQISMHKMNHAKKGYTPHSTSKICPSLFRSVISDRYNQIPRKSSFLKKCKCRCKFKGTLMQIWESPYMFVFI